MEDDIWEVREKKRFFPLLLLFPLFDGDGDGAGEGDGDGAGGFSLFSSFCGARGCQKERFGISQLSERASERG